MEYNEIEFRVESDLEKCRILWEKFSPNESVFDLWDYRTCFNEAYTNKPYFIVGKKLGKEIGIIPLEHDKNNHKYWFFGGGDWNEKFKFFIDKEIKKHAMPEFFKFLPQQSELISINNSELDSNANLIPFQPTYFMNPQDFNYDFNSFLASLSPKRRKHLRQEFKKLEQLNPVIKLNNFSDFSLLVYFNKKRFGTESSFHDFGFEDVFKLLLQRPISKIMRMISIYIHNELKACAISSVYNNTYTFLQGANETEIDNLGKYLNYQVMLDAFNMRVGQIDFLSDDCGWKENWNLKKEMLYELQIPDSI